MPDKTIIIDAFDDNDGIMQLVQEQETAAKPKGVLATISGNALKVDIVNKNKRLYKGKVMEDAILKAQPKLAARKLLGEVDHPDGLFQNPSGSLARAAIRFTDLWKEENLVKYKGYIMNVEEGRKLHELLEAGVGAGVSTRGRANSHREKINNEEVDVIDDFDFFGIDVVLNPANPAATEIQVEGEKVDFSNEAYKDSFNGEADNMENGEKIIVDNIESISPELLESIKVKAVEDAKAGIEQAITEALTTKHTAEMEALKVSLGEENVKAIEAAKAEVLASEEIQGLFNLKKIVGEAVADFNAKNEKKEETSKVEEISAKLTEAEAAANEWKTKFEAAELARTLAVNMDSLLKDYPYASIMRARIEKCETVESMNDTFNKEKVFIEDIVSKSSANGIGKTKSPIPSTAGLDEQAKIRQRKLAGIGK